MKILVVELSALHLGYLGCYGNDWVATPNLDRLAAEGVVFDQHLADGPTPPFPPLRRGGEGGWAQGELSWDQPGLRSCWTGRYHFPLPKGEPPLAPPLLTQTLAEHAIHHQLLACSRLEDLSQEVLAAIAGLKRQERWLLWVAGPSLAPPWQPAEEALEEYFPPDEEEPLQPWLHPPVAVWEGQSDDDLERLQNTYAAMVTTLDQQLGKLLGALGKRGLLEEMWLLLTASCGLALGEHGVIGASQAWLHEEVLHLPLLLRLPRAAEAGLRLPALTQPVDLPATLLDILGLPMPPAHGYSLLPLLRGQAESVRPYAVAGLGSGDSVAWTLRTPQWALLLPAAQGEHSPRLFVKPDDRWEVNDVRQHHLEWTEQLEQTLRSVVEATRQPGPLPKIPLFPRENAEK